MEIIVLAAHPEVLKVLAVFVAVICADYVWADYTISLQRARHVRAGIMAMGIYGFGAMATILYVSEPVLISVALVASFIGTFIGSKYRGRS